MCWREGSIPALTSNFSFPPAVRSSILYQGWFHAENEISERREALKHHPPTPLLYQIEVEESFKSRKRGPRTWKLSGIISTGESFPRSSFRNGNRSSFHEKEKAHVRSRGPAKESKLHRNILYFFFFVLLQGMDFSSALCSYYIKIQYLINILIAICVLPRRSKNKRRIFFFLFISKLYAEYLLLFLLPLISLIIFTFPCWITANLMCCHNALLNYCFKKLSADFQFPLTVLIIYKYVWDFLQQIFTISLLSLYRHFKVLQQFKVQHPCNLLSLIIDIYKLSKPGREEKY